MVEEQITIRRTDDDSKKEGGDAYDIAHQVGCSIFLALFFGVTAFVVWLVT